MAGDIWFGIFLQEFRTFEMGRATIKMGEKKEEIVSDFGSIERVSEEDREILRNFMLKWFSKNFYSATPNWVLTYLFYGNFQLYKYLTDIYTKKALDIQIFMLRKEHGLYGGGDYIHRVFGKIENGVIQKGKTTIELEYTPWLKEESKRYAKYREENPYKPIEEKKTEKVEPKKEEEQTKFG